MDRNADLKIIETFVGKKCERTLACNSLKIRFGEKASYIWLDPPWELWSNDGLITSSHHYPEDEVEFQAYSGSLNPLNKTKLLSFDHTAKDGLVLHFQNGFRLLVPTTISAVNEEDFYHHWYACAKKHLTNRPSTLQRQKTPLPPDGLHVVSAAAWLCVMETWGASSERFGDAFNNNTTNGFFRTQQGEIVQFSFEFLSGTVRHSVATQRTR